MVELNKTLVNALMSHIDSLRQEDKEAHRVQDKAIERIDKRVQILEEAQHKSAPGESGG